MRRLSGNDPREIQYALDDIDRRLRRLEEDDGMMGIPVQAARAPVRGARVYFDEQAGKLVVVTADGISYWSKD
jgi:hypothetical protein